MDIIVTLIATFMLNGEVIKTEKVSEHNSLLSCYAEKASHDELPTRIKYQCVKKG